MDPNANLAEQLKIAKDIEKVWDDCNADGTLTREMSEHVAEQANRLAELVLALDGWLTSGGFPPTRWAVMT